MQLVKEITIHASLEEVYGAYADIRCWRNVLSDVVDVHVYYDDTLHQEFDMTVQRHDYQEKVHSIRFCYPCFAIEIFQTQPPPFFKSMSGVWTFTPEGKSTAVRATRRFELKDGSRFDATLLEGFLEKNLTSFKAWIERNNA